jgi:hypothetical protein
MNLLSRLFSGRTPVTARQLGEACARQAFRAAFEGEDSLAQRLERLGVPVRERDEVALFSLVPFDRAIEEEYGGEGAPVRESMCESAAGALRSEGLRGAPGPSSAELAERLDR